MDTSDTPKARRPLPTPGGGSTPSQQRPSTPVTSGSMQRPISPAQFYGTKAPPLPTRPNNSGSSHAAYPSLSSDPPRYGSPSSAGYREPELVAEGPVEDEEIPALIPPDNFGWDSNHTTYADWDPRPSVSQWGEPVPSTYGTVSWDNATGTNYDDMDFINTRRDPGVPIDNRSDYEESKWWSQEERSRNGRPGPGRLAPVLAEELHDPHHSLFSVNVASIPNPSSSSTSSTPLPAATQNVPHSTVPLTASASTDFPHAAMTNPFPTEDEVRAAIPHANAYYCPKDNSWVLLIWKSSSVIPLTASTFQPKPHPLPDQTRRKRMTSCVPTDGEQSSASNNKTHHFHRYPKAIDSLKLTTPFLEDSWRAEDIMKQKRRGQAVIDDIDILKADQSEGSSRTEKADSNGVLLDLYVCCQCSFYCVVSDVIPGVIPRKYMDEFVKDKRANPAPGKTPEHSVITGVDTLLVAIENKIFKGNNRLIKINSTGFQTKLGWTVTIKRIFDYLGFVENTANNDATLMSPLTDFPAGVENRKKLLRAWVELNAWIADFKRVNAAAFRDHNGSSKAHVQIDSAREMYQRAIGAHPDQIPRGELQGTALAAVSSLVDAWRGLGLTPTSYSPDVLTFAYLAQCRCDPGGTPRYFTYLSDIVSCLTNTGDCPVQLQELVAMEQSRQRFTLQDIQNAAQNLGFGPEGLLGVDYDEDVEEEFVENAWKETVKRSWKDANGAEMQRTADEALRILSEARGSTRLRQIWENKKNAMSPERAWDTLEIPKDVDDHMLITVFNMRLEESASQMDKMREALTVIAEERDSERLRIFLSTGQDPGEIVVPIRPDFPRGLNQLGNTCYLNSLLQYFYTIKDLRDAVLPMSKLDLKALEEEKLADEDIKKHRVGGRQVSRREIIRSKKFVYQLANLFFNMEYDDNAAITPSIELAKLALVTSRDEEEDDEADKVLESESSKSSVLGKRARDLDRQSSVMDVDGQDVDGFVMVSSPRRSKSPNAMDQDSPKKDKDGDVAMQPVATVKKRSATTDSGGMMFGKQHDVAECMDNCMFQIETALLKFGPRSESKSSIVKRLFYGKIRQRLTSATPNSRASIHEKEDLFSHLPVNVADDGVDIYDGLSGYFDDVVDYEGGKARMEVSLVDVPALLQIQLQRVQFNRETLQPYKSQAYVKFGETIYLDRFMDSADARKKMKSRAIQRELNASRERIRLLLEGKNGPFISTLDHTASYLDELKRTIPGIDAGLIDELQQEKRQVEGEIEELKTRVQRLKAELEGLWASSRDFPYELTSVFIHRGSSPSFGHYFFYSRHLPEEPDSWFKYNDSDVSIVPKDEVLQDTTGSTANPYLLVFARKGANVVETVKRFDPSLTAL